METEWTDNGLKIAFDPIAMKALWQSFLSWGWMIAVGLMLLGGFTRMAGFRIKKARAHMKEHPGLLGKLAFTVTAVSVVVGGALFCISNAAEAREAALNDDLPGAWKVLYESMNEMEEEQARLLTLGVFLENAPEDAPTLGLAGFTRIMNGAFTGGGNDQNADTAEIQNLTKMLKRFVTVPAFEAPSVKE